MPSASRVAGRRRLPGALLAGAASSVLLAGCGGDDASERTAAASSSAATVLAVSPEQLRQGAGIAAASDDLEITPESCRAAVDGTQPDIDDFADLAAQSATTGASSTVQMLLRDGPIGDSVAQLADAGERCPEAQISSPKFGSATIAFENLPVDDLGDRAALLRYTITLSAPDGSQVSVPTLIGAVEDGDRLLLLLTIDAGQSGAGATDPAAFADLLAQAHETQADALD